MSEILKQNEKKTAPMHTTTTFNISIHIILRGTRVCTHRCIKKRRPLVAYPSTEAFALPNNLNKQQETYADMTNHTARTADQSICQTHRHLLLTLVWFRIRKLLGFVLSNSKASINAIQYVWKPTLHTRDIPVSVSFRCKSTTKNWNTQEKCYFFAFFCKSAILKVNKDR